MKRKVEVKVTNGTDNSNVVRLNFCSICRDPYIGFGHNASPVTDGRCCDDCQAICVLPARIALIYKQRK